MALRDSGVQCQNPRLYFPEGEAHPAGLRAKEEMQRLSERLWEARRRERDILPPPSSHPASCLSLLSKPWWKPAVIEAQKTACRARESGQSQESGGVDLRTHRRDQPTITALTDEGKKPMIISINVF